VSNRSGHSLACFACGDSPQEAAIANDDGECLDDAGEAKEESEDDVWQSITSCMWSSWYPTCSQRLRRFLSAEMLNTSPVVGGCAQRREL
jgi:hypothetical protein